MTNVKGTVLVTSRSFSTGEVDVVGLLSDSGLTVVRGAVDHNLDAIGEALETAVGWIAGTSPVTAEHFSRAPHLRVLARYGVGLDSVDLMAAAQHGVMVTNTPGANSRAVADHTVALMLSMLRGIVHANRAVRSGDWRAWRTHELGSLVIGVVGLGRIGMQTVTQLAGFGAKIVGYDPFVNPTVAHAAGVTLVTSDEIPSMCDIVVLHAPGGQIIVDESWLKKTRDSFILVNTARADLVDEVALVEALHAKPGFRYAADALMNEHRATGSSPLLAPELADQVVVTPHLAANTVEAVDRMGEMSARNVIAALTGAAVPNLVSPGPAQR